MPTQDWFEPVNNILFVNDGMNKKTRVWYDEKEWEDIFINTGIRATKEGKFFENAFNEMLILTDRVEEYISGKKTISSLQDWKEFYELWIKWWGPMAVIFTLPESETAPKHIRDAALELRAKTEKYSDGIDSFSTGYLMKRYQEYADLIALMTPDEVGRIDELSVREIEDIKKRKNGFVFLNGRLYGREELDTVMVANGLKLNESEIILGSEVKGAPASLGIAIGKVVVVYGKKDLGRIDADSILVTEMTSPDYVPYMKIAKAVVTDEGGINCHAAIVAREMKKPCIIGTKIATKIFKDGDRIEVDADKGIVRILKN